MVGYSGAKIGCWSLWKARDRYTLCSVTGILLLLNGYYGNHLTVQQTCCSARDSQRRDDYVAIIHQVKQADSQMMTH